MLSIGPAQMVAVSRSFPRRAVQSHDNKIESGFMVEAFGCDVIGACFYFIADAFLHVNSGLPSCILQVYQKYLLGSVLHAARSSIYVRAACIHRSAFYPAQPEATVSLVNERLPQRSGGDGSDGGDDGDDGGGDGDKAPQTHLP